jgi:hypothetical protein
MLTKTHHFPSLDAIDDSGSYSVQYTSSCQGHEVARHQNPAGKSKLIAHAHTAMSTKWFIIIYCCRCDDVVAFRSGHGHDGAYRDSIPCGLPVAYVSNCVFCKTSVGAFVLRPTNAYALLSLYDCTQISSALNVCGDRVTIMSMPAGAPLDVVLDMVPHNLTFEWLTKNER